MRRIFPCNSTLFQVHLTDCLRIVNCYKIQTEYKSIFLCAVCIRVQQCRVRENLTVSKLYLYAIPLDLSNQKSNWNVVEVTQKPVKCPFCSVRFKTDKNVPRHVKSMHSEEKSKRLQCYLCKKLYRTKGNYDDHYRKTHAAEHLLYVTPEKVQIKGT